MTDGMTSAASKELTGSYSRLERAAMGVVPVQEHAEAPAPRRPAARERRTYAGPTPETRRLLWGRVRAVAVMVLVVIGLVWWTGGRRDFGWAWLLMPITTVLAPVGFIIWASLTHKPRRPVPRLPWPKRANGQGGRRA